MQVIDCFAGTYRFLSNFYPSPVEMPNGLETAPTVEHAYQAMKTRDRTWQDRILAAKSPGEAKKLGRKVPLREDWEQTKDEVMMYFLRKKFANNILRLRLVVTGAALLIEGNTWGDQYWGVCNGAGQNKLGKMLMQLRKEFQDAECA